jgi:Protein of unknown function (DUF3987)
MSQYNGNGNGSASISFPPFGELIEEYCDRNPKERSKYLCPACGGGNLSVNKNTGAFTCHNDPSKEHNQEITTALNNSYKAEHPELSSSKNGGMTYKAKPMTERQTYAAKRKAAQVAAVVAVSEVEMKVEELVSQLDPSTKRGTEAALHVEMAAWARAHGHDVFSATRLLAESLKRASVASTLQQSSTHSNTDTDAVSTTVVSVELLLDKELRDWQELEELTQLQNVSGLTKDAFWSMVASLRMERNIKAHVSVKTGSRPVIDWSKAPVGLEAFIAQMNKDASKRSVDPTAILWAVLPAVMSVLSLNANLDLYGLDIPAVMWSALLMESGHGKSRAEGLVMEPLRAMQSSELKDFKAKVADYEEASRSNDSNEPVEKPAAQRKYMFNIATIASIMESLSHQTLAGSIWLRDEVAGIFKSLGQFSKGDNEEKEIFLALWDGETAFTDRKSSGSSETSNPRLSLFGGLQPGKFRQVFKDMDDVDGMAARVMLAYPGVVIDRHKEGQVKLPFLMRSIYEHLQNANMQVTPERAAYELWNEAQYQARLNAEKQSSGAIAAWMRKMPGHLGRMAFAIHALECGCNGGKQTQTLTLETMRFAVELCRYSLESYRYMLQQGTDSQDVESVVSKILGKANQLGGLTVREAVQYIKPLTGLAKENKKTPSSMALDLFSVLVEQGKGSFIQTGKTKKFIPTLHLSPVKPQEDSEKSSTLTTVAETIKDKGFECVEVDRNAASTLDENSESTNEEKNLEIGQTITITGGLHKDSVCLVLEIEEPYPNGEVGIVLLKDNYPLAMNLSTLVRSGYRIEVL